MSYRVTPHGGVPYWFDKEDPGAPAPPAPFDRGVLQKERARLRELLLGGGILYQSDTQPVRSRDGSSARWMLETWPVSMSDEGGRLAGALLWSMIQEHFEGRQIATYGQTAIPLLQSTIHAARGELHGVVVRKQRKAHGSSKQIEGKIDLREPVILLDDSVASGTSMYEGTKILEEAGFFVEGGLVLVRFDWGGGPKLFTQRKKKIFWVFDIFEDLMFRMPDEVKPRRNPTDWFALERATESVAGDTPAEIARRAMEFVLKFNQLPRVARKPRRQGFDTEGGCWVSVRDRSFIHQRYAREGFWRFPWEPRSKGWADDVVCAAAMTALKLPSARALDDGGLAVTGFGPLVPVDEGGVDNDRFGLCVRSKVRPGRMGGALPRMPGITHDLAQLKHARDKNARGLPGEPFEIFRHDVFKDVEMDWQPTGVPLEEGATNTALVEVAERARRKLAGEALSALSPLEGDALYLTVYQGGALRGCMGAPLTADLELVVDGLADAASKDARFFATGGDIAVTATLLTGRLELGHFDEDEVMKRVRLGEQALAATGASRGDKMGILLPQAAARLDLTTKSFAREVCRKAGLSSSQGVTWTRYETETVSDDGRAMFGALPKRAPARHIDAGEIEALAHKVARYVVGQQRHDGGLIFSYDPLRNLGHDQRDLARNAYGAFVLGQAAVSLDASFEKSAAACRDFVAGHQRIGEDGLLWLGPKEDASIAELSFFGLADNARGHRVVPTLITMLDEHGRFQTHEVPRASQDASRDYFSPQALFCLGVRSPIEGAFDKAIAAVRMRFSARPDFGAATWLLQALDVWDTVRPGDDDADFAMEVCDFLLAQQNERGYFTTTQQPEGPGFTSALYVEGLASAHTIAMRRGDIARMVALDDAMVRALAWSTSLVVDEGDARFVRSPVDAIGAVLGSPLSCRVRIDFALHFLAACLGYLGTADRG